MKRTLIVEPLRYLCVMPPRGSMLSANAAAVHGNNPSVAGAFHPHQPLAPRCPSGRAALDLISPSEKLVCRSFTLGRRNSVSIVQRE